MSTSTRRGRPQSFDREEALDRAALLFWAKGYEATSIRGLAEALEIGQPSLYNAFGDKRALFTEAVDYYEREYGVFIGTAIEEEASSVGALRRILAEAPSRYVREGLPRGCLVACGEIGTDDEQVHADMARRRSEGFARLAKNIDTEVARGELPPGTDSAGLAGFVMATINGIAQRARDGAERAELEAIARIAQRALP